jgi:hypothetical protein
MKEQDQQLMDSLNQHPVLRYRVEELLNVVNNIGGNCIKASEAEHHVIDELRKMGNDALRCWGGNAVETSVQKLRQTHAGLQGNGQKKSVGIVRLGK